MPEGPRIALSSPVRPATRPQDLSPRVRLPAAAETGAAPQSCSLRA